MSNHSILRRKLGSHGPELPAIGLGCMSMSPGTYGDADPADGVATLNRAVELGSIFWDTSNIYGIHKGHPGFGGNEKLIAPVLNKHRDQVFICTKFAVLLKPDGTIGVSGKPEYARQCCEESLRHLGVDTIDLYYQHRIDPETPIEDTVAGLAELVKEGKVRYIGLSECSADTLRRAYKVHPIAAVQVEYSPWTTDIEENGLLEACRELGVAIVAYSPLGRGFLTGSLRSPDDLAPDDWRRGNPRFQGENFKKNLEIADAFQKLAAKKGCSAGQLCLAWVLAQGPEFFVIPGTKRVKYLEDNVGAASVKLDEDELAEIRQLIKSIQVSGARYDARGLGSVNR